MTSHPEDNAAPTPGTPPKTGSPGYQTDSREPATSAGAPQSPPSDADEERIDPYLAFAQAAAADRERKKREQEPGIWLPGEEELDVETGRSPDGDTAFSGDGWRATGNPQVSVRLRPRDFGRLREAADFYGVRPTTFARMMVIRGVGAVLDAELRRKAAFLKDP